MFPKRFAFVGGIVMLAMGLLSLIPALVGPIDGLPALYVQESYGWFLNTFPMNIFNKVALILFGIGGIYAATRPTTSLPASIKFSRWTLWIMGPLAILGLFPQTNTLFGYWPLFGAEAAAHGLFALLGAFFGYSLSTKAHSELGRRGLNDKNLNRAATSTL